MRGPESFPSPKARRTELWAAGAVLVVEAEALVAAVAVAVEEVMAVVEAVEEEARR